MAYSNYSGKCVGRQLYFLYSYTHRADSAIFEGDGQITLHGQPLVEKTIWLKDTDIPVFKFADQYKSLYRLQRRKIEEELRKLEELDDVDVSDVGC